jgi:zinc and cadmium transporter
MVALDIVFTACLLSNAAGLAAAALVARRRRADFMGPRVISFAVGVLLGAVLLDLLPDLWDATGNLVALLGLLAAALLASRLFDRVCACDHTAAAGHVPPAHRSSSPPRGKELLLAGDFLHSLVDGALIVAALTVGVVPGAVATMAVGIHEVPRRVAIVALLLRAGCRPLRVLALTACAALCTVFGGLLAWWSVGAIQAALPFALALSAAAMLYVALAQSARLVGAWRTRVLVLECSLPFAAGVLVIGGSHRLLEAFG